MEKLRRLGAASLLFLVSSAVGITSHASAETQDTGGGALCLEPERSAGGEAVKVAALGQSVKPLESLVGLGSAGASGPVSLAPRSTCEPGAAGSPERAFGAFGGDSAPGQPRGGAFGEAALEAWVASLPAAAAPRLGARFAAAGSSSSGANQVSGQVSGGAPGTGAPGAGGLAQEGEAGGLEGQVVISGAEIVIDTSTLAYQHSNNIRVNGPVIGTYRDDLVRIKGTLHHSPIRLGLGNDSLVLNTAYILGSPHQGGEKIIVVDTGDGNDRISGTGTLYGHAILGGGDDMVGVGVDTQQPSDIDTQNLTLYTVDLGEGDNKLAARYAHVVTGGGGDDTVYVNTVGSGIDLKGGTNVLEVDYVQVEGYLRGGAGKDTFTVRGLTGDIDLGEGENTLVIETSSRTVAAPPAPPPANTLPLPDSCPTQTWSTCPVPRASLLITAVPNTVASKFVGNYTGSATGDDMITVKAGASASGGAWALGGGRNVLDIKTGATVSSDISASGHNTLMGEVSGAFTLSDGNLTLASAAELSGSLALVGAAGRELDLYGSLTGELVGAGNITLFMDTGSSIAGPHSFSTTDTSTLTLGSGISGSVALSGGTSRSLSVAAAATISGPVSLSDGPASALTLGAGSAISGALTFSNTVGVMTMADDSTVSGVLTVASSAPGARVSLPGRATSLVMAPATGGHEITVKGGGAISGGAALVGGGASLVIEEAAGLSGPVSWTETDALAVLNDSMVAEIIGTGSVSVTQASALAGPFTLSAPGASGLFVNTLQDGTTKSLSGDVALSGGTSKALQVRAANDLSSHGVSMSGGAVNSLHVRAGSKLASASLSSSGTSYLDLESGSEITGAVSVTGVAAAGASAARPGSEVTLRAGAKIGAGLTITNTSGTVILHPGAEITGGVSFTSASASDKPTLVLRDVVSTTTLNLFGRLAGRTVATAEAPGHIVLPITNPGAGSISLSDGSNLSAGSGLTIGASGTATGSVELLAGASHELTLVSGSSAFAGDVTMAGASNSLELRANQELSGAVSFSGINSFVDFHTGAEISGLLTLSDTFMIPERRAFGSDTTFTLPGTTDTVDLPALPTVTDPVTLHYNQADHTLIVSGEAEFSGGIAFSGSRSRLVLGRDAQLTAPLSLTESGLSVSGDSAWVVFEDRSARDATPGRPALPGNPNTNPPLPPISALPPGPALPASPNPVMTSSDGIIFTSARSLVELQDNVSVPGSLNFSNTDATVILGVGASASSISYMDTAAPGTNRLSVVLRGVADFGITVSCEQSYPHCLQDPEYPGDPNDPSVPGLIGQVDGVGTVIVSRAGSILEPADSTPGAPLVPASFSLPSVETGIPAKLTETLFRAGGSGELTLLGGGSQTVTILGQKIFTGSISMLESSGQADLFLGEASFIEGDVTFSGSATGQTASSVSLGEFSAIQGRLLLRGDAPHSVLVSTEVQSADINWLVFSGTGSSLLMSEGISVYRATWPVAVDSLELGDLTATWSGDEEDSRAVTFSPDAAIQFALEIDVVTGQPTGFTTASATGTDFSAFHTANPGRVDFLGGDSKTVTVADDATVDDGISLLGGNSSALAVGVSATVGDGATASDHILVSSTTHSSLTLRANATVGALVELEGDRRTLTLGQSASISSTVSTHLLDFARSPAESGGDSLVLGQNSEISVPVRLRGADGASVALDSGAEISGDIAMESDYGGRLVFSGAGTVSGDITIAPGFAPSSTALQPSKSVELGSAATTSFTGDVVFKMRGLPGPAAVSRGVSVTLAGDGDVALSTSQAITGGAAFATHGRSLYVTGDVSGAVTFTPRHPGSTGGASNPSQTVFMSAGDGGGLMPGSYTFADGFSTAGVDTVLTVAPGTRLRAVNLGGGANTMRAESSGAITGGSGFDHVYMTGNVTGAVSLGGGPSFDFGGGVTTELGNRLTILGDSAGASSASTGDRAAWFTRAERLGDVARFLGDFYRLEGDVRGDVNLGHGANILVVGSGALGVRGRDVDATETPGLETGPCSSADDACAEFTGTYTGSPGADIIFLRDVVVSGPLNLGGGIDRVRSAGERVSVITSPLSLGAGDDVVGNRGSLRRAPLQGAISLGEYDRYGLADSSHSFGCLEFDDCVFVPYEAFPDTCFQFDDTGAVVRDSNGAPVLLVHGAPELNADGSPVLLPGGAPKVSLCAAEGVGQAVNYSRLKLASVDLGEGNNILRASSATSITGGTGADLVVLTPTESFELSFLDLGIYPATPLLPNRFIIQGSAGSARDREATIDMTSNTRPVFPDEEPLSLVIRQYNQNGAWTGFVVVDTAVPVNPVNQRLNYMGICNAIANPGGSYQDSCQTFEQGDAPDIATARREEYAVNVTLDYRGGDPGWDRISIGNTASAVPSRVGLIPRDDGECAGNDPKCLDIVFQYGAKHYVRGMDAQGEVVYTEEDRVALGNIDLDMSGADTVVFLGAVQADEVPHGEDLGSVLSVDVNPTAATLDEDGVPIAGSAKVFFGNSADTRVIGKLPIKLNFTGGGAVADGTVLPIVSFGPNSGGNFTHDDFQFLDNLYGWRLETRQVNGPAFPDPDPGDGTTYPENIFTEYTLVADATVGGYQAYEITSQTGHIDASGQAYKMYARISGDAQQWAGNLTAADGDLNDDVTIDPGMTATGAWNLKGGFNRITTSMRRLKAGTATLTQLLTLGGGNDSIGSTMVAQNRIALSGGVNLGGGDNFMFVESVGGPGLAVDAISAGGGSDRIGVSFDVTGDVSLGAGGNHLTVWGTLAGDAESEGAGTAVHISPCEIGPPDPSACEAREVAVSLNVNSVPVGRLVYVPKNFVGEPFEVGSDVFHLGAVAGDVSMGDGDNRMIARGAWDDGAGGAATYTGGSGRDVVDIANPCVSNADLDLCAGAPAVFEIDTSNCVSPPPGVPGPTFCLTGRKTATSVRVQIKDTWTYTPKPSADLDEEDRADSKVHLILGAGNDMVSIYGGAWTGSITATGGNDAVRINALSAAGNISLGDGDNSVDVIAGAEWSGNYTGGSGNDTIKLESGAMILSSSAELGAGTNKIMGSGSIGAVSISGVKGQTTIGDFSATAADADNSLTLGSVRITGASSQNTLKIRAAAASSLIGGPGADWVILKPKASFSLAMANLVAGADSLVIAGAAGDPAGRTVTVDMSAGYYEDEREIDYSAGAGVAVEDTLWLCNYAPKVDSAGCASVATATNATASAFSAVLDATRSNAWEKINVMNLAPSGVTEQPRSSLTVKGDIAISTATLNHLTLKGDGIASDEIIFTGSVAVDDFSHTAQTGTLLELDVDMTSFLSGGTQALSDTIRFTGTANVAASKQPTVTVRVTGGLPGRYALPGTVITVAHVHSSATIAGLQYTDGTSAPQDSKLTLNGQDWTESIGAAVDGYRPYSLTVGAPGGHQEITASTGNVTGVAGTAIFAEIKDGGEWSGTLTAASGNHADVVYLEPGMTASGDWDLGNGANDIIRYGTGGDLEAETVVSGKVTLGSGNDTIGGSSALGFESALALTGGVELGEGTNEMRVLRVEKGGADSAIVGGDGADTIEVAGGITGDVDLKGGINILKAGSLDGGYTGGGADDTLALGEISGSVDLGGGENRLEASSAAGISAGSGNDTVILAPESDFTLASLSLGTGMNALHLLGRPGGAEGRRAAISLSGGAAEGLEDSLHLCNLGEVACEAPSDPVNGAFSATLDASGAAGNTWDVVSVTNHPSSERSALTVKGDVTLQRAWLNSMDIRADGAAGDTIRFAGETAIASFRLEGGEIAGTVFEIDVELPRESGGAIVSGEADILEFLQDSSAPASGESLTATPALAIRVSAAGAAGQGARGAVAGERVAVAKVYNGGMEIDGFTITDIQDPGQSRAFAFVDGQRWALRSQSFAGHTEYSLEAQAVTSLTITQNSGDEVSTNDSRASVEGGGTWGGTYTDSGEWADYIIVEGGMGATGDWNLGTGAPNTIIGHSGGSGVFTISGDVTLGDSNDTIGGASLGTPESSIAVTGEVDLKGGINVVRIESFGEAGGAAKTIRAGDGLDTVEVSGAIIGNMSLGAGDNMVAAGGDWSGSYTGLSGDDTVLLGDGATVAGDKWDFGGGSNVLAGDGGLDANGDPVGSFGNAVDFGGGNDTVRSRSDPGSASAGMNMSGSVHLGDGENIMRISSFGGSGVSVSSIRGGKDADTLDVAGSVNASVVNLGNGRNTVSFGGAWAGRYQGGSGVDEIILNAGASVSGSAWALGGGGDIFRGSGDVTATLNLGDGDDRVGWAGADRADGSDLNLKRVSLGGGDDFLRAGSVEFLSGGSGSDTAIIGPGGIGDEDTPFSLQRVDLGSGSDTLILEGRGGSQGKRFLELNLAGPLFPGETDRLWICAGEAEAAQGGGHQCAATGGEAASLDIGFSSLGGNSWEDIRVVNHASGARSRMTVAGDITFARADLFNMDVAADGVTGTDIVFNGPVQLPQLSEDASGVRSGARIELDFDPETSTTDTLEMTAAVTTSGLNPEEKLIVVLNERIGNAPSNTMLPIVTIDTASAFGSDEEVVKLWDPVTRGAVEAITVFEQTWTLHRAEAGGKRTYSVEAGDQIEGYFRITARTGDVDRSAEEVGRTAGFVFVEQGVAERTWEGDLTTGDRSSDLIRVEQGMGATGEWELQGGDDVIEALRGSGIATVSGTIAMGAGDDRIGGAAGDSGTDPARRAGLDVLQSAIILEGRVDLGDGDNLVAALDADSITGGSGADSVVLGPVTLDSGVIASPDGGLSLGTLDLGGGQNLLMLAGAFGTADAPQTVNLSGAGGGVDSLYICPGGGSATHTKQQGGSLEIAAACGSGGQETGAFSVTIDDSGGNPWETIHIGNPESGARSVLSLPGGASFGHARMNNMVVRSNGAAGDRLSFGGEIAIRAVSRAAGDDAITMGTLFEIDLRTVGGLASDALEFGEGSVNIAGETGLSDTATLAVNFLSQGTGDDVVSPGTSVTVATAHEASGIDNVVIWDAESRSTSGRISLNDQEWTIERSGSGGSFTFDLTAGFLLVEITSDSGDELSAAAGARITISKSKGSLWEGNYTAVSGDQDDYALVDAGMTVSGTLDLMGGKNRLEAIGDPLDSALLAMVTGEARFGDGPDRVGGAVSDGGLGSPMSRLALGRVILGGGDDELRAVSAEHIMAGPGGDTIELRGAAGTVDLGDGGDSLTAASADAVMAGPGDDVVSLAGAAGMVDLGDGLNTLIARSAVSITGGSGNDTVTLRPDARSELMRIGFYGEILGKDDQGNDRLDMGKLDMGAGRDTLVVSGVRHDGIRSDPPESLHAVKLDRGEEEAPGASDDKLLICSMDDGQGGCAAASDDNAFHAFELLIDASAGTTWERVEVHNVSTDTRSVLSVAGDLTLGYARLGNLDVASNAQAGDMLTFDGERALELFLPAGGGWSAGSGTLFEIDFNFLAEDADANKRSDLVVFTASGVGSAGSLNTPDVLINSLVEDNTAPIGRRISFLRAHRDSGIDGVTLMNSVIDGDTSERILLVNGQKWILGQKGLDGDANDLPRDADPATDAVWTDYTLTAGEVILQEVTIRANRESFQGSRKTVARISKSLGSLWEGSYTAADGDHSDDIHIEGGMVATGTWTLRDGRNTIRRTAGAALDPAVIEGSVTMGAGDDSIGGASLQSPESRLHMTGSVELGDGSNVMRVLRAGSQRVLDSRISVAVRGGSHDDTVEAESIIGDVDLWRGENRLAVASLTGSYTGGDGVDRVLASERIDGSLFLGGGRNQVDVTGSVSGGITAGDEWDRIDVSGNVEGAIALDDIGDPNDPNDPNPIASLGNSLRVGGAVNGDVTSESTGLDSVLIGGGSGNIDLGDGPNSLTIASGRWTGTYTEGAHGDTIVVSEGAAIGDASAPYTLTLAEGKNAIRGGGSISGALVLGAGDDLVGGAEGSDSDNGLVIGSVGLGDGENVMRASFASFITAGSGNDTVVLRPRAAGAIDRIELGGGSNSLFIEGRSGRAAARRVSMRLLPPSPGATNILHLCGEISSVDSGCGVRTGARNYALNLEIDAGDGAVNAGWSEIRVGAEGTETSTLALSGNIELTDPKLGRVEFSSNGAAGDDLVVTGSYGITGETVFELDFDASGLRSDTLSFIDATSLDDVGNASDPPRTKTPFIKIVPVSASGATEASRRVKIFRTSGADVTRPTIDKAEDGSVMIHEQAWTIVRTTDDTGAETHWLESPADAVGPVDRGGVSLGDASVTWSDAVSASYGVFSLAAAESLQPARMRSGGAGVSQSGAFPSSSIFWTSVRTGREKEGLTEGRSESHENSFQFVTSGAELFVGDTGETRVTHFASLQYGQIESGRGLKTSLAGLGYGVHLAGASGAYISFSGGVSNSSSSRAFGGRTGEFDLKGHVFATEAGRHFRIDPSLSVSAVGRLTESRVSDVRLGNGDALRGLKRFTGDAGLKLDYVRPESGPSQSRSSMFGAVLLSHDFGSDFQILRPGQAPLTVDSGKAWVHGSAGMSWGSERSSFHAEVSLREAFGDGGGSSQSVSLGFDLSW